MDDIKNTQPEAVKPQYLVMMNDQMHNEQGIDLIELMATLYKKRYFVLRVVGLTTLIATTVAFLIKPQYQIKTELTPPHVSEFESLRLNTGTTMDANQLFSLFVKQLSKKSNIFSYLEESGLVNKPLSPTLSTHDKINYLNKWAKNYQVSIINHNKNDAKDNFQDNSMEAVLTTILPSFDPSAKANLAYLNYTNQKIIEKIAQDQREIIETKKLKLEKQIQYDIDQARVSRENKIKRLENQQHLSTAELKNKIAALEQRDLRDKQQLIQRLERALIIAKTLGITNPHTKEEISRQNVLIRVNKNSSDLYLRGTIYLERELAWVKSKLHTNKYEKELSELQEELYAVEHNASIEALKTRSDDKPYAKKLAEKELQLEQLKAYSFKVDGVSSFNLAGEPLVDADPVTPNKLMIVMGGVIGGLMLAILFVIIHSVLMVRREQMTMEHGLS